MTPSLDPNPPAPPVRAILLCPVRGCRQELIRESRRLVCPQSHSFDIARRGYVNLLQPQDRRSRHPGDTAEAIAARRRLHDLGITQPLLEAIRTATNPTPTDTVLDAGCGEGFYLGHLARETGIAAHGIDISTPAVEAAASRFPACEWVVANADRFIPHADDSFSLILSITARMNAPEFHRLLQPAGRLLIALPSPQDLIELRGAGRDRASRTVASFPTAFTLIDLRRITTQAHLEAPAVQDLLTSIYRPMQSQAPQAMNITLSLDLLLFEKNSTPQTVEPSRKPLTSDA